MKDLLTLFDDRKALIEISLSKLGLEVRYLFVVYRDTALLNESSCLAL